MEDRVRYLQAMRGAGNVRLPGSLLAAVALMGLLTLAIGVYLEQSKPAWLQAHPISANLISSVIGFSAVTFVVGVGFNAVSNRSDRAEMEWRLLLEIGKHLRSIGQRIDVPLTPAHTVAALMTLAEDDSRLDSLLEDGTSLIRRLDALNRMFTRPYVERYLITGMTIRRDWALDLDELLDRLAELQPTWRGGARATLSRTYSALAQVVDTFETDLPRPLHL